MATLVEQGKDHTFSATFVNQDGTEATILGTPTIEVRRTLGTGSIIDLTATPMTNVTGSTYAYVYHIPSGKKLGDYYAIYRATYSDSSNVVFNEVFTVCTKDFFQRIKGAGLYKTSVAGVSEKVIKSLTEEVTALEKMISALQSKMDLNSSQTYKDISDKIDTTKTDFDNQYIALGVIKEDISKLRETILLSSKALDDVTSQVTEVNSIVSKTYLKTLTDEELEEVAKNGH